jgi:hypothetical protein
VQPSGGVKVPAWAGMAVIAKIRVVIRIIASSPQGQRRCHIQKSNVS